MLSVDYSNHVSPRYHHTGTTHTPWFARPVHLSRSSENEDSGDRSFYPSRNEESEFSKNKCLSGKAVLPSDPRYWNREDVQNWINQMAVVHGLPSVDADRFLMNGKALCLMTMDMFCQRVPLGGKMLYKDFQLRLCNALYSS